MAEHVPASRPVVVCDLDGVVWLGGQPLPGARDGVARLRETGRRVLFVTNNSSRTVGDLLAMLADVGIDAGCDDVVSSATAAARLVARGGAGRVVACGGPGVVEALEAEGIEVVERWPCDAVVVGWHREFDFERLERAATAVRRGARFVATNLDATYPTPEGLVPGGGAIVAAVATASGRAPEVAGKPAPPTVELVSARAGGATGWVVGDRPSTDGALAAALGWPFALVTSEVTGSEEGDAPRWPVSAAGATLDQVAERIVEQAS